MRRNAWNSLVVALLAALSMAMTSALLPAPAQANADVDLGWQRYLEADFEGALEAFARAERGTLDRAELVSLLEGRAQVQLAAGDQGEVDATLTALASLAPSHRLSPESPPELLERFGVARRRSGRGLSVQVDASRDGGVFRVVATVQGDAAGLARRVRVVARIAGLERVAIDEPLELDVTEADSIEYWVEVLGPGRAVVATLGDAGRPEVSRGLGAADDATWLWVGVGVGGGVVLVAAIVIGVFVGTQPPPLTQPSAPALPMP